MGGDRNSSTLAESRDQPQILGLIWPTTDCNDGGTYQHVPLYRRPSVCRYRMDDRRRKLRRANPCSGWNESRRCCHSCIERSGWYIWGEFRTSWELPKATIRKLNLLSYPQDLSGATRYKNYGNKVHALMHNQISPHHRKPSTPLPYSDAHYDP